MLVSRILHSLFLGSIDFSETETKWTTGFQQEQPLNFQKLLLNLFIQALYLKHCTLLAAPIVQRFCHKIDFYMMHIMFNLWFFIHPFS